LKKLNDKELNKVNQNDLHFELASERKKRALLELKNLEFEARIVSYKAQEKRAEIKTLEQKETSARTQRQEFIKQVAKKKNLSGSWGFDPYSGEITQGEE
jgi:hypothetical protein